jgi:hypothetical protein
MVRSVRSLAHGRDAQSRVSVSHRETTQVILSTSFSNEQRGYLCIRVSAHLGTRGSAYFIVRHYCREWSLLPTFLSSARNYKRRVYKWSLRSSACNRASISYIPDRPTHSPDPTLFSTLAMLVRTPPDPIALPCTRVEVVPSRARGTCCCSSRRYC